MYYEQGSAKSHPANSYHEHPYHRHLRRHRPRLARERNDRGHTAHGIDRAPYDGETLATVTTGDLLNPTTLQRAPLDVDCIGHLAAAKGDGGISEEEYYRDNLDATRAIIEAGKEAGVKHWIFYSTVSTLGSVHREQ